MKWMGKTSASLELSNMNPKVLSAAVFSPSLPSPFVDPAFKLQTVCSLTPK